MRKSGILMHLSSLASPHGIGTMGKEAREFVDFLHEGGQSLWQLLPICPTSYGDSPYQSYSTFAGNPYFIDLDKLEEMGLLQKSEYEWMNWGSEPGSVNYGVLYEKRYPLFRLAAGRFFHQTPEDFELFCKENENWLEDYSLFMTLKDVHNGAPWSEWQEPYRNRSEDALQTARQEYKEHILFWKALQYLFFKQWNELKVYANDRGVSMIGDLPIYVSLDSVDVWAHPELFQLDEAKNPKEVAGVPPDGFTEDGQLWGNPLFDWEYMEQTNYAWWVQRIHYLCQVYDILRIDHFRGFESYFAVPFGSPNAKNGYWKEGPGMKLFRAVEQSIGRQNIIAEDLGYLTDSVRNMLRESGFPGMKVLEFAFDSKGSGDNEYLPHNYIKNCVAYAGTHDNDTILGWFQNANPDDVAYAKEYLHIGKEEELNWGMMSALWGSVADTTIVQAQDILGLGSEARMNQPSTTGKNWSWRAQPEAFTHELAQRLRYKMKLYGRLR